MIRNALIGMYREIENLIQLVYFCRPNQIIGHRHQVSCERDDSYLQFCKF